MIAITLAIAAGLVFGYAMDPAWGWAAFGLVLLAALLYHLRRMQLLARWLERGETPEPPRAYGDWDRLHALLHRSRRDSTRRQAELAQAAERWQDASRALPEGVVILENGRIEWLNDMAQVHLQLDAATDQGRVMTHLVRIPALVDYLERADFSKPVMVELRDPEARVISMQAVDYGDWKRLVLTRDVTQFQRVERMRREFVANVSHELRTPLTVVTGFIETLREETDPAAMQRYLDLMAEQGDRMQRLVEDLLVLSALESAPPPPMEERVSMRALVDRLATEARALSAGRHGVVIEDSARFDLLGAESELASAFGNLVTNAVRYTPAGGTLTLRWRAEGEGATFEVEDTGIGIAAEHIPRLTERFYRVDRGRSRETGGTGLGLAIVKHALVRHGAALHVTSEPGRGTTFAARFGGPRLVARAGSAP